MDDPWIARDALQNDRGHHASPYTVTLTTKYDELWYHGPPMAMQTPYNSNTDAWHHEPTDPYTCKDMQAT